MPNIKLKFNRPTIFWIDVTVALVVIVAALIAGYFITQAAPPQPFPYSHAPHIAIGMQCLFCHPGASRYPTASLPTLAKCQSCHANMATTDRPALKAWNDYVGKLGPQQTLEWTPVAIMPDFVYFSHQPHIAAKLNCETCHGNVGGMTAAQPQPHMDMGWCLNCHKALAPERAVKLTDCATCHK